MTASPAPPSPLPYELRLGVTGHRELAHPEATQEAITALLTRLQTTFTEASAKPYSAASAPRPKARNARRFLARLIKCAWWSLPVSKRDVPESQQTPLAWTVVSSLAVGADRLVANAVLEMSSDGGGARLETVLPLPADDYRRDFESEAEQAEFDQLLGRSDEEVVAGTNHESHRNRAYLAAGRRVADSCEILIAVWDGVEDPDGVGTAAIVRYAVNRGRSVIWIDALDPSSEPRWIVPKKNEESGSRNDPLPQTARELSNGFFRHAAYNRDPAFDAHGCAAALKQEKEKLLALANSKGLPEQCLSPVLDVLLPHYARADQLAARYQHLYKTTAKWLYTLAAVAVTIPVLQLLLWPAKAWIIVFEVIVLLIILALLDVGRHEKWHQKWLQDRHLAERLRIAIFSIVVDLSSPEHRAQPEQALPYYGETGGWVRAAAAQLARRASRCRSTVDDLEALRGFVIDGWINGQITHHKYSEKRHGRKSQGAHRAGLAIIYLTLLAAVLHMFGVGHFEPGDALTAYGTVGVVLILLTITLPAWGVAIHAITAMLDHDRIQVRSAGMARILRFEVLEDIKEAATHEQLQAAVARAKDLMLSENYEWVTSLAFHDLHHPG